VHANTSFTLSSAHPFCGSTRARTVRIADPPEFTFKSRKTGPLVWLFRFSTRYVPGSITRFPARNSNGIWAVIVVRICAEAAPAATTREAVAIINLIVSFFIVIPSFGFAAASPIRTLIRQVACHCAGARKALKTRAEGADFHPM